MVVIQNIVNSTLINEKDLESILQKVISDLAKGESELLIRLVDRNEIQALNKIYRHKDKVTNVLSFPSNLPIEIEEEILGDVVICPEVVQKEANEQHKTFTHHLIHIAIHGVLHLFGYNHIKADEAYKMENLEIKILAGLGIQNPYIESINDKSLK